MNTHGKISEFAKHELAVYNADIVTPRTSTYRSARDFRQFAAVLVTSAITAGKKATVQLMQAKDALGTDAKVLGDAVNSDILGGSKLVQAEAYQAAMDGQNGFTHIAVTVSSDDTVPVVGAAVLVLADASYKPVA